MERLSNLFGRLQHGNIGTIYNEGRLAWRLMRDQRVPIYLKLLLIAAGVYLILPDPTDVVPILGQLDDLTILVGAMSAIIKLSPNEVVEGHRIGLGLSEKKEVKNNERSKS